MSKECVEALADLDNHPRSMAHFMEKLFHGPREIELDKMEDDEALESRLR